MNRSRYFDYIDEKLNILAWRIEKRGKLNLLDLNIFSETFFADMLNILFGFQLKNLNNEKQNVEGIDLVDEKNKIIAQVSSTCTKQKVESSLAKDILEKYKGYRFKFISISKDAKKLKQNTFYNPHNVLFEPMNDIIDIPFVQNKILSMQIDQQRYCYEFFKKEFGNDIDIVKVDSNLATIINILAKENLDIRPEIPEVIAFEINKKIEYNDLLKIRGIIDDYKVYYKKLNEKYEEYDKQGVNKTLSILSIIRNQYFELSSNVKVSQDLFFSIIDSIIDIIVKSKNYIEIPYEELEMCVHILVVDAFIRCKIFENPEGYNYVITR